MDGRIDIVTIVIAIVPISNNLVDVLCRAILSSCPNHLMTAIAAVYNYRQGMADERASQLRNIMKTMKVAKIIAVSALLGGVAIPSVFASDKVDKGVAKTEKGVDKAADKTGDGVTKQLKAAKKH